MPYKEPAPFLYRIPGGTYNYMLAPLLRYSIDGMIWYQGESNTYLPENYKGLFEQFVILIREHFGTNLPIIFTQLANYIDTNGNGENWAALREQQRQCMEIPHTAMAVTIDCGEYNDLHPQDKKTVGERLALCAQEEYPSPTPVKVTVKGGMLSISFDHGEGLWAKNGRPMVEVFAEGKWAWLYAEVSANMLWVKLGDLQNPEKVRFGWTDCPPVILYNAHNLPASPFVLEI